MRSNTGYPLALVRSVRALLALSFLLPTWSASAAQPAIRRIPVEGIIDDVVTFHGSVWLADAQHRVLELDPDSGRILRSVHVPGSAGSIAAGSGALWVVGASGTFRIDPDQGVAVRLQTGQTSVVAAGGNEVWTQNGDGSVSRIDPVTGERLVTAQAAEDKADLWSRSTRDLAVDARGAWLADGTTGEVVRISRDGATERFAIGPAFEPIGDDAVREGAYVSTVAVGGGSVWVCCNLEEQVVRLDPASGAIIGATEVAVGGGDVALTFAEGSLWMSESLGGIYRVNPRTLESVGPVEFHRFPTALAVGERNLWAVEGESDGDLSAVRLRDFAGLVGEDTAGRPSNALIPIAVLGGLALLLAVAGLARRGPQPRPA
jgi:streptogramin lyase